MNLLQKAMNFKGLNGADSAVGVLGILAPALSAASAGTVGLIGALAPLGGLLAALPGMLLGAAQGLGVLKFATAGVGGALGGLNEQLNPKKFMALTGPGQQFVLVLDAMKKPVRDLQGALQRGLFPGLTSGLKAAAPALGVLRGPLEGTARVLGSFGSQLGHLVGSKGFLKDLRDQAGFNNVQLGRLGGGLLHVVDGLRQLGVASRPLISWLTGLTTGWAAAADKTLTANRANGKLAGTFRIIQRVSGEWFKILGNVGHALFNIGNLGRKNLGESLLGSLVKGSAALRKWTESGPGLAKITRFFTEAKPALSAFAELLKAVVVDIFKLGQGGGGSLALLFGQLRTQVLPMVLLVTKNLATLFFWVDKTLPGGAGAWLLTIGYLLSKILDTGAIAKAAFKGLGAKLGVIFAGSFETVALAGMYAIDWAKGLGGAALAKISTAGAVAGTVFQVAFLGGMAFLGLEIGKYLATQVHFHFDPARILKGESPIWVTTTAEERHNLAVKTTKREGIVRGADPVLKHFGYLNPHPKLALGGMIASPGIVEVGERGPELLHLPRSAMVTPLSPSLRAPTMTEVRSAGGYGRAGDAPIHVHSHMTITMNGKPIAEGTNEVVARSGALA
jgi:hypothetical protein